MKIRNKKFIIVLSMMILGGLYFYKNQDEMLDDDNLSESMNQNAVNVLNSPPKKSNGSARAPSSVGKNKSDNYYKVLNRQKTIEAFQTMLDYPETSAPLDPEKSIDYLQNKYKPEVKEVLGTKDPRIVVTAWTNRNYYLITDKTISLFVVIKKENTPLDADKILASIDGRTKIPMNRISQGKYIGSVDVDAIGLGKFMLQVDVDVQNENISTLNGVDVSDQYAEYKGSRSFLDSDGNLVFEHELNVLKRGAYLVEGIVYDESGKMVAKAHSTAVLSIGVQAINLNFYGYIFYKKKISGRFNLKNIEISYVGENLETLGQQLIQVDTFSQSISWDQFNNKPYNNELIDEKLAHL